MTIRLYTTPKSANGVKTLAVADHLGLDVEIRHVDVYGGEGRRPGFLRINPQGKIPVLLDGTLALTESNAIVAYLAERYGDGRLWSPTSQGRADILRWLFWEASEWQPALVSVLRPHVAWKLGLGPEPPRSPDWDGVAFRHVAAHLNDQLAQSPYLVGGEITVADYAVAAMLLYIRGTGFPRAQMVALGEWADRVHAQSSWIRAVRGSLWSP